MKTQSIGLAVVIALVGVFTLPFEAFAQPGRSGTGGRGGLNQRFENNSPAVGDLLPNLSVFDEHGQALNIRSLKDKYSVIVFGCLT